LGGSASQAVEYQYDLCDVSQREPSLLSPDWHEHLSATELSHMNLLRFQRRMAARTNAKESLMAEQTPKKPNILVIWGDDIGITNLSCYSDGLMGYRTPNIDRIAKEGMRFTDSYGEQSCTAGRSSFITGQSVFRTGLSKVGLPGADVGLQAEDPTIAELLKPRVYATGQFGKNHFGDLNKFLPTVHGFDEFYGNLYHLNAEEDPEDPNYPKEPKLREKLLT